MSTGVQEGPGLDYLDGRPKRLLINGEWVLARSEKTFDSINPSTGEIIGEVAEGDAADVDAAVAAARRAFEGPWSKFTPQQRQNVMLKLADLVEQNLDELRLIDVVDMGAPVQRIRRSNRVVENLRYFAGWPTKIHGETIPNSQPGSVFTYTLKQPVGVCASIIAWNGPLGATLSKIAPVLATGCTTILKPAEEASLTALRIGELIADLDLPPGVINIVTGYGESAGAALTSHPGVDKVAFTGSSSTGQNIVRAAAGNLKRVSLELGGKSPNVIFADANLDAAVPGATMAVFGNSGQVCYAGTRVFVERPIYDEFVARMSEFARALVVGNSLDPATEIGPVVSRAQLDRVTDYLDIGKNEGARTTAGGARLVEGDLANGYFVAPTVFADVEDDMRVAKEEIFGPVAAVLPFDTIDEVKQRANLTQFGLGGGVWTRDVGKAHQLAAAINTGVVWVNSYGLTDPAMPHGGTKMSGWGREYSSHGLDEYLNVKAVWIRTDV
jgi:aldehyde dehydrogenase (NAD+)